MLKRIIAITFLSLSFSLSAFAQTGPVDYEYDALGRLERTTYTANGSVIEYTYDENGNRTEVLIQRPGEVAVEPATEGEPGGDVDLIIVPNGTGGYNIIVIER